MRLCGAHKQLPCPRLQQILMSVAEHHSVLAPFQLVAAKRGAKIVDVNLTRDSEEIDLEVGGCCLL